MLITMKICNKLLQYDQLKLLGLLDAIVLADDVSNLLVASKFIPDVANPSPSSPRAKKIRSTIVSDAESSMVEEVHGGKVDLVLKPRKIGKLCIYYLHSLRTSIILLSTQFIQFIFY